MVFTYKSVPVSNMVRLMFIGEAEFINDIQIRLNELFGAFVLTTVASATIENVDASEALVSYF